MCECNYEVHVCTYESVGLLCLYHVTYVKRCLCASRRHLRALWESRVNEASMIFAEMHTHT